MNTTAFGLIVAIPLLLVHTLLQTKTTEIIDSLEMASVKFLNAITERARQRAGSPRLPRRAEGCGLRRKPIRSQGISHESNAARAWQRHKEGRGAQHHRLHESHGGV